MDKEMPWKGICCMRCWMAKGKRCTCKCEGRHHGQGLPKESREDEKEQEDIQ